MKVYDLANLNELSGDIHDLAIKDIRHGLNRAEVKILFDNGKCLNCNGLVGFKSEAYFHKGTISADKVYVATCKASSESWFIDAILSRFKPDGEKKWGDADNVNFKIRKQTYFHINLYCNDWEFDIACESIRLEDSWGTGVMGTIK
jgi:hypothetical protein